MSSTEVSGGIGEHVKSLRAQRRMGIPLVESPGKKGMSGDNLKLQNSSSTAASRQRKSRDESSDSESEPPKKKSVWDWNYNDDSDGAESEADQSLATTPNIRRNRSSKHKEADSTTATLVPSPTKLVAPPKKALIKKNDDLEEGEIIEGHPKKVVDKSSAKKRMRFDSPVSSASKTVAPPAKKQKINAKEGETVKKDISTQGTSIKKQNIGARGQETVKKDMSTRQISNKKQKLGEAPASNKIATPTTQKPKTGINETESVEKNKKMTDETSSKKRKVDDGPASTSDKAVTPPPKKQKTSTEIVTAPKKTASPKKVAPPERTVEKKPIRKTAASMKTSTTKRITDKPEELPAWETPKKKKLTQKQKQNQQEFAGSQKAYRQLPKEYQNNSRLRVVVDTFCMTKGIGLLNDMEFEQQERLVKEMKKRAEYVALLDIRKSAVSSRTREENRWKNKGQYDNHSAILYHERQMAMLQHGVDDADKSIDAWEARDGNITYRNAYNAAVAVKSKNYKIHRAGDEGMPGRRSASFAARLPVEVWEKRVADDADCDNNDADSEKASRQKSREDRLQQTKKGKSSAASKSDGVTKGTKTSMADEYVD